jgi:uncharacterized RDD family membrane protein YckC
VQLDDLITIATPEGIELELVLAGAGSRFIAAVVDFALEVLLIVLAALVTTDLIGGGIGEALLAISIFAALYVYDVAFEVLAAGRTPGKRLTHLRVVRDRGNPVDLPASAIRNLLRVIDLLPGAYLVGLMSILLTKRNQRLGDLAAGTLVIRDMSTRRKADVSPTGVESIDSSGWDVSAVSAQELVAIRRFLERRESLDRRARAELAHRLEQGLRTKVAGAPDAIAPEVFLQALAAAKSRR